MEGPGITVQEATEPAGAVNMEAEARRAWTYLQTLNEAPCTFDTPLAVLFTINYTAGLGNQLSWYISVHLHHAAVNQLMLVLDPRPDLVLLPWGTHTHNHTH
jgi:hypothetical protein